MAESRHHPASELRPFYSPFRLFVIFLLFFFFASSPAHSRAFHPPSGLTFVRSNGRYWPLMFVYANSLDSPPLASTQLESSKSIGEFLEEEEESTAPTKRAIMRLGKRAMMRLGRKK